ncbi:MAG TPA: 16S rRNA (cytosine(1402)-N(4))-methyltransferase RsmH [Planctomycetaceae bacterium]|nr:16S rRNA (cytosine(1402)-N(4))-methyltransferase RsmH [Planctomycetaceae bacterium]
MPAPDRTPGEPAPAHVPVLLKEVLQILQLHPGQIVVDGTIGAAGHSREILRRIGPQGTLIGLDRDALMLEIAARQLSPFPCHLQQASYAELPQVLAGLNIPAVDCILLDLGLSSDQLADRSRGFSFSSEGPLDLRFDVRQGEPASELVARLGEQELATIFERFGEEPDSRRVARSIVNWRLRQPIRTGRDLAEAVSGGHTIETRHSRRPKRPGARHPATRVFQALRIAVNDELGQLQRALGGVLNSCLKSGGIAAVISFHSLEDRLVKLAFRESTLWQLLCPKPIAASPAEQRFNPRSRTARLRAAKKL